VLSTWISVKNSFSSTGARFMLPTSKD
jgi:hypothetical protein